MGLARLMHRLKNKNLISGFRAAGIHPLDRNQVLKHLPTSNKKSEEINSLTIVQ